MICSINNLEVKINSFKELYDLINKELEHDFSEIFLYKENKTVLTILANTKENKVFLIFQNLKTDKSYTPFLENSNDIYIDFLLSNGQIDQYSINWLVDLRYIEKIILSYYENGTMWNGINWIEN